MGNYPFGGWSSCSDALHPQTYLCNVLRPLRFLCCLFKSAKLQLVGMSLSLIQIFSFVLRLVFVEMSRAWRGNLWANPKLLVKCCLVQNVPRSIVCLRPTCFIS